MSYIKLLKFCLLSAFLLLVPCYIQSVPRNFKRLVKFDSNQQIEKVVDLIGDTHMTYLDLVKKASVKRKQKLLQLDERKVLTVAERTLLQTLREMAQRPGKQKISLLWELSLERDQNPPQARFNDYSYITDPFIAAAGFRLYQELSKNPTSKLKFIDADTYRAEKFLDILLLEYLHPDTANFSAAIAVAPLLQILETENPKVTRDRNALKQYAQPHITNQLIAEWETFKQTTLEPLVNQYINSYLMKNPTITIGELKKLLEQQYSFKTLEEINDATDPIIEYEILFKLFGDPNRHIIVYAGSKHTMHLYQKLAELGFITLVNVGDNTDPEIFQAVDPELELRNYDSQLMPDAWKLLKNLPENSVLAYRAKGPIERTVSADYWELAIELISRSEDDEQFVKELESWIKVGFHNYIDSPNSRFSFGKPLLVFFVRRDLQNATKLLLKYGANPNAHFFHEIKGFYVSVFDMAQEMNNQEMINLLLKYGVQPTFKREIDGD